LIVVLDSNVWVSALHFRGAPLSALTAAFINGPIVCCREIRAEVLRTLVEKLDWSPPNALLAMQPYLDGALEVQITGSITGICRDPKDDMLFECASLARAPVIVSGDKDVLAVPSYAGIKVMSVRAYLHFIAQ
jgi:putative PIN family toxin of toxin-antitoxin system